MEIAQDSEIVLDGVAALDSHQRSQLVLPISGFDVCRAERHHHPVGMFARLLVYRIDQLKCPVSVLAGVQRRLDPDGKELSAQVAVLGFIEIEMQVERRLGNVEVGVEKELRRIRVRIYDYRGIVDRLS